MSPLSATPICLEPQKHHDDRSRPREKGRGCFARRIWHGPNGRDVAMSDKDRERVNLTPEENRRVQRHRSPRRLHGGGCHGGLPEGGPQEGEESGREGSAKEGT